MTKSGLIKQIVASGILASLAITFGYFVHFSISSYKIYLVGIVIFLMPLFLRIDFLIISTIVSVVLTDVLTSNASISWISMIAYSAAVIPLRLAYKFKFKYFYIIGLVVSSLIIILIYFSLEKIIYDSNFATTDLIATSIQMAIIVPVVTTLYLPLRVISFQNI